MKRILLFVIVLIIGLQAFSQVAPNKYYVQFTDKNNSPYSIDNPEEFLTQRAIDRRDRYGIQITAEDLPVNPQYLEGVTNTGVALLNPTKWLNGVTIYTADASKLDEILALPYVQSVYLLSGKKADNQNMDEKPFFKNESYFAENPNPSVVEKSTDVYDYGDAYNQIHMLNGDALHNMGLTGKNMVIAVLDAGFFGADTHIAFDSLFNDNRVLGTKDFVAHSGTVYDYHTHGTSVLSTMAANVPGQMVGTAPDASYWLLRTEDGASEYIVEEYNWVSGAEYADSVGADVINSSLGYTTFDDPAQDHTYEDMDGNTAPSTIGADIAASKGILVVNSAGNSGSDPWYYIGAPADGNDVFTIGAVDASGYLANFSSRGPTYDGRIKPNICAQGYATLVADPYSGSFAYGSGTSFSSPIIAGMSASLWQGIPDKSNEQIMQALMANGNYASDPNNDYGWGIPDYLSAYTLLTVIENSSSDGEQVKIYPNPVQNQLNVWVNGSKLNGNAEITVFDQSGRKILQYSKDIQGGHVTLNGMSELASGIYFLQFIHQKNIKMLKFVK